MMNFNLEGLKKSLQERLPIGDHENHDEDKRNMNYGFRGIVCKTIGGEAIVCKTLQIFLWVTGGGIFGSYCTS